MGINFVSGLRSLITPIVDRETVLKAAAANEPALRKQLEAQKGKVQAELTQYRINAVTLAHMAPVTTVVKDDAGNDVAVAEEQVYMVPCVGATFGRQASFLLEYLIGEKVVVEGKTAELMGVKSGESADLLSLLAAEGKITEAQVEALDNLKSNTEWYIPKAFVCDPALLEQPGRQIQLPGDPAVTGEHGLVDADGNPHRVILRGSKTYTEELFRAVALQVAKMEAGTYFYLMLKVIANDHSVEGSTWGRYVANEADRRKEIKIVNGKAKEIVRMEEPVSEEEVASGATIEGLFLRQWVQQIVDVDVKVATKAIGIGGGMAAKRAMAAKAKTKGSTKVNPSFGVSAGGSDAVQAPAGASNFVDSLKQLAEATSVATTKPRSNGKDKTTKK